MQNLRLDLAAQLLLETADLHVVRIAVDEVGQIEIAGGDVHRRADEAAQLASGLIRLIAQRPQKLTDVRRVVGHLPGRIDLNENPQAVAGADVLQAGRRGPQAQIDRYARFDGRGQLPRQPRRGQDPHGIAQAADHHSLVGRHHDDAFGDEGDQDNEGGDGHAQHEAATGLLGLFGVQVAEVQIKVVR